MLHPLNLFIIQNHLNPLEHSDLLHQNQFKIHIFIIITIIMTFIITIVVIFSILLIIIVIIIQHIQYLFDHRMSIELYSFIILQLLL